MVDGRKIASSLRGMVVPGSQQVKAEAEAGGPGRGLPLGRLRVARVGMLDVPGDEPGHPAAGRALRLDLQPQLRGPPGRRRAHPPGQPEDGGGGRSRGPLRRHQGVELGADGPIEIIEGRVAVLDRADVDTDQIMPKQFLKRIGAHRLRRVPLLRLVPLRRDRARAAPDPGRRPQLRLGLLARARRLGPQGLTASTRSSRPRSRTSSTSTAPRSGCCRSILDEEHCRAVAGAGRRGSTRRPDRHLRRTASSSSRSTPTSSTGSSTGSTTSA